MVHADAEKCYKTSKKKSAPNGATRVSHPPEKTTLRRGLFRKALSISSFGTRREPKKVLQGGSTQPSLFG